MYWTYGIDYANYPGTIWNYYDNATIMDYYGLSAERSAHFGIVYLIFTLISICVYIRLLCVICFTKELWCRPAYKLIVSKGILDVFYIFGFLVGGLCSIVDTRFTYWFIKIIGATLAAYYAGMPITLLLAINRFLQMVFAEYVDRVFSDCLLKVYLAICWLLALLAFAIFVSPLGVFAYFPIWSTWIPVFNTAYSSAFNSNAITFILDYDLIAIYGITCIIYLALVIFIIVQKNKLEISEIRLTIQLAGAAFIGILSSASSYFLIGSAFPGYLSYVINSMLAICTPAVDPFFYSLFNETIREKMIPNMCKTKAAGTIEVTPVIMIGR